MDLSWHIWHLEMKQNLIFRNILRDHWKMILKWLLGSVRSYGSLLSCSCLPIHMDGTFICGYHLSS
ncbi:hypothetical protein CRYUN_Cryun04dG0116000 [Craigia yunnanensis]